MGIQKKVLYCEISTRETLRQCRLNKIAETLRATTMKATQVKHKVNLVMATAYLRPLITPSDSTEPDQRSITTYSNQICRALVTHSAKLPQGPSTPTFHLSIIFFLVLGLYNRTQTCTGPTARPGMSTICRGDGRM